MEVGTFVTAAFRGPNPRPRLDTLQRTGTSPEKVAEQIHEQHLDHEPKRPLRCRACGALVTSETDWIRIDGRSVHRRTNPFGFEFEFGCFRAAPGVRIEGQSTSVHTWFVGFNWVVALCGACGAHLGWHFQGSESSFFALILASLVGSGADETGSRSL